MFSKSNPYRGARNYKVAGEQKAVEPFRYRNKEGMYWKENAVFADVMISFLSEMTDKQTCIFVETTASSMVEKAVPYKTIKIGSISVCSESGRFLFTRDENHASKGR